MARVAAESAALAERVLDADARFAGDAGERGD